MPFKISFRSERGQSSIEAAFILPILLLCLGLSVQPVIYMYTKTIMQEAADEGIRYAMSEQNAGRTERYIRRRLEALPSSSIFHVQDEDWDIDIIRADKSVRVLIRGHIRTIPVLGVSAYMFLEHDDQGLIVEVASENITAPSWREGDYESWTEGFVS